MYEHADQSWRHQPHAISNDTVAAVINRVADYCARNQLSDIEIVFHGGEPLLAGSDRLVDIAERLRSALPATTRCSASVQTNGALLTRDDVAALAKADIAISVSLDGPANVNDRHRVGKHGESTFAATEAALDILAGYPQIFGGVLAVIDPRTDPGHILDYFATRQVPSLDFLLPDANHAHPPPGREDDPQLYSRWLIRAFDIWFDRYGQLPVRTFDALLAAVCGEPSPTDAFGLGEVNLLTIETDGSYHDLDVLKITYDGASALHLNVADHDIDTAMKTEPILRHAELLTVEGLSDTCQRCAEVRVCGGGAVPHRYSDDGFGHPSVYCNELLTLIGHVRYRLADELQRQPVAQRAAGSSDIDLAGFDRAASARPLLEEILASWTDSARRQLDAITDATTDPVLAAVRTATVANPWLLTTPSLTCLLRIATAVRRGRPLRALDGAHLQLSQDMAVAINRLVVEDPGLRPFINRADPLLRAPFGHPIHFIGPDHASAPAAKAATRAALDLIRKYDPALGAEIALLCTDIQFISDAEADPDKTVSFSDDAVPGALYIAPQTARGPIEPVDLADSLIHEHRHQKLYLLQRRAPLVADDRPLVASPWREEPRPPSGVLHAVFVFSELHAYWVWIAETAPSDSRRKRGAAEADAIANRLIAGVDILGGVALTETGRRLVAVLGERTGLWS